MKGGPFRYVDTFGASRILGQMEDLASRYDKRFAPCELLIEHAKRGKPFHAA